MDKHTRITKVEFVGAGGRVDITEGFRGGFIYHSDGTIEYLEREGETHLEKLDKKYNEILAGIAVLNSPTCKSSYYSAGFFMAGTEKLPLMTGLMDHWFQTSQSRGFRVVQFGNFWVPGNPSSWKGFSDFKAKFGAKIIVYQPLLFRVMLG